MKFAICLALFFLSLSSQILAQRKPHVEDTIAGITVGKSSFGDVQRKYGTRLILDQGRYAVRWDGECELFFDLEQDHSDRPDNPVWNIQLLNLGKGAEQASPCNDVTTGSGLKLSDSPLRVRALYGRGKQKTLNGLTVFGYDSKPRCKKGSRQTVILHGMGVEWASEAQKINNINLGLSTKVCGEIDSPD
jgi:hypothetical protein